jgi:hypothetical protein
MTDSVIVAAPLLIAAIVMTVGFVGCRLETSGIPGAGHPPPPPTPPTPPELKFDSKTDTTITVTASGGAGQGGAALAGYNFYLDKTKNNTTPQWSGSDTYTYTYQALAANTPYEVITATVEDIQNNESAPSNDVGPQTTDPAPPPPPPPPPATTPVTFDADSEGSSAILTNGAGATTWKHTVGSGRSNAVLFVGVAVSDSSGLWVNPPYASLTVSSSVNGAFTQVGSSIGVGPTGQAQGSISLFKLVNPSAGIHTITASVSNPTWSESIQGASASYYNVASIGTPVTQNPNGAAALSLSVSANADDIGLLVGAFSSQPTGITTQRVNTAGGTTGWAEWLVIADHANNPTVTFSSTSSGHEFAAIAVDLIHS